MHVVFKLLGALYQEPGRNCAAPLKMCAQAKRHYRPPNEYKQCWINTNGYTIKQAHS